MLGSCCLSGARYRLAYGPADATSTLTLSLASVTSRLIFSTRCNIYISRLCYEYDVSVRLSVRLSVTEVTWRLIANIGLKLSNSDPTLPRIAAAVLLAGGSSRAMLASARSLVPFCYWLTWIVRTKGRQTGVIVFCYFSGVFQPPIFTA